MRMGWLVTLVLVIAAIMPPIAAGQAQAQEAQGEQTENCSLPEEWDPAEDLPRILAEHREWVARWRDNEFSGQWAEDHPEGRANLCNAALRRANLWRAALWQAKLGGAALFEANLTEAALRRANLTEANLRGANLTEADLDGAALTKAALLGANLTEANLFGANLTEANLFGANLTKADLYSANLTKAILLSANLTEATLSKANLTNTVYAPASLPPNAYVAGIQGLRTIVFPRGQETGLVQLRELLQKAGLRDLALQLQVPFSPKNIPHSVRAPYAPCANWAHEKARTADLKRIVQP
jgi:hypothetical protein